MALPFTHFGGIFRGLNPLASFTEAGGLAESVSRPIGSRIADFLDSTNLNSSAIFDRYLPAIQKGLASPIDEERVRGLRQFQLALQLSGSDSAVATELSAVLRNPRWKELRTELRREEKETRRILARHEPQEIPHDTGIEGRIRSWIAGASNSEESLRKLRIWCFISRDLHAARRLHQMRAIHQDFHAGFTDITDVVRPPDGALGWFFLSELSRPCRIKYDFSSRRMDLYTSIRMTTEHPRLRALLLDSISMYVFQINDWIPFLMLRQGALYAAGGAIPSDISLAIGRGLHTWLLSLRSLESFLEIEKYIAGHFSQDLTLEGVNLLLAVAQDLPNPVTDAVLVQTGEKDGTRRVMIQSARNALKKIASERDDFKPAIETLIP